MMACTFPGLATIQAVRENAMGRRRDYGGRVLRARCGHLPTPNGFGNCAGDFCSAGFPGGGIASLSMAAKHSYGLARAFWRLMGLHITVFRPM